MTKNLKILPIFLLLAFKLSFSQDILEDGLILYEKLKSLSLDDSKIAEVVDLSIKKDAATFNLNKGKIYLLKPFLEKITGFVFIGEGTFEFTPPTQIEKYQLERFTKIRKLNLKFTQAYFRFTDNTVEELEGKLRLASGEVESKAKKILKDGQKRALRKLKENLNVRILKDLWEESSNGFFYCDIHPEDENRMFFSYYPDELEEVLLKRESPGEISQTDVVCSFHKKSEELFEKDYEKRFTTDETDNKDEIRVENYKMGVKIKASGELEAEVEIALIPLLDGIRVLKFYLSDKLKVKEVKDENGDSLGFIREKNLYDLFVILQKPLEKKRKTKLFFKYSGDILDQNWYGDYYIKSTTYWYPRYGYFTRSSYDLTFRTPKQYKFVSIGKKKKEKKEGEHLITSWKEDFPVSVASFNMGNFDIYEMKYKGLPDVKVFYVEESHRRFTQDFNRYLTKYDLSADIMIRGAHMKENIGADVTNSINFFQKTYGKLPFSKIAATEIPASYGQGFPGLLHLSWGSFQKEEEFKLEAFRAHEVSHQWWGHIVGWKTYHDLWLCEGFAEYSGLWFAQLSTRDNKKFFTELESFRKDILGKGNPYSDGSRAGPLWLGYRLDSSKSKDYITLVYEKGAYILHMLRNMMIDFSNFSDDKFKEMMKDFVKTYYGKDASTGDFKRIVDKHTGEDMSWFFDQWVYGTEIPKYIYSYSVDKVGDKFQVAIRVKQKNVSSNFKMPVPVVVVFKDESYSIFRIMVDKPYNEIKLPLVEKEVKEVVFNPFHSVLCEVEEE